jgi:hypothetical protein
MVNALIRLLRARFKQIKELLVVSEQFFDREHGR